MNNSGGCVAAITLAAVVAVVAWFSDWRWPNPEEEQRMKGSAASLCRQLVAERLGTPASADFREQSVTALDSGQYRVVAFVQWPGGGEAPTRADYQCRVQYGWDTNGWTLLQLDLPGR